MTAGDVFRLAGVADIHTWVVISDPKIDANRVLIVNFTSWDTHEDQACILDVGDHPFITHRTCVNFPRARVASNADLDRLRVAGRIAMLSPLSVDLLKRLREGAMDSTRLSLELGQLLIDQRLVG